MSISGKKWYKGGLQFTCTECGNCCTGPPGYVWVTVDEIRMIAEQTGRTDGRLPAEHLRRVGTRYSLTERANGDCVYLVHQPDGKRVCGVYSVRPLQCRTWPFWTSNLRNRCEWDAAGGMCPGINTGRHWSFEQIEQQRTKKRWW